STAPGAAFAGSAPAALTHPAPAAGTHTLLVCPWRGDGHRDHRVVGEVCAALAAAMAAAPAPAAGPAGGTVRLVEYPIWLWHWGAPSAAAGAETAAPWSSFTALPVPRDIRAAKLAAIAAHRSQTAPLSSSPGDEALLNPTFLQNFDHDREVFIVSESPQHRGPEKRTPQLTADYFDDTYARHDDPWGFTDRWYEERKRAVTLAALPRAHFENTFEIGCSIGVLTAQLAPRTDRLLGVDIAPAAIERARQRLATDPHVELAVLDVAETFPAGAGPFDLILLSEVGYYFDEATLRRVLDGVAASLRPDGVFVACHWRHPVADYLQSGDGVHRVIAEVAATAGWTRSAHHLEEDFVLDVFAPDARSVAGQTGLL
ncbi:hypothetical protein C5B96_16940, partial [Subtercola sp. Z020]|uniref:class I SAM-dependent DNA methyltransferase n=1 Tax=Subtercola sp. Z020 TaxID=2080582 RepID=UPI000CE7E9E7